MWTYYEPAKLTHNIKSPISRFFLPKVTLLQITMLVNVKVIVFIQIVDCVTTVDRYLACLM